MSNSRAKGLMNKTLSRTSQILDFIHKTQFKNTETEHNI